jgi:hypothetical protein
MKHEIIYPEKIYTNFEKKNEIIELYNRKRKITSFSINRIIMAYLNQEGYIWHCEPIPINKKDLKKKDIF